MFVNLSNHPSTLWNEEQTFAAKAMGGTIVDLPFPTIDPSGDETSIANLVDEYVEKVLAMGEPARLTVHVMGEMTFTFAIITKLLAAGTTCVASTTERITRELPDGRKESIFRFVRFRQYQ